MINPIQQNVSFQGAQNSCSNDNFTGTVPASAGVRADYNRAVAQVLDVQQKMTNAIDEHSGKNLNIVA